MPQVPCCSGYTLPDDVYIHVSGSCPCLTDTYKAPWQTFNRWWEANEPVPCNSGTNINFKLFCAAGTPNEYRLRVACPSGTPPDVLIFNTWQCDPFSMQKTFVMSSGFGCCPGGTLNILINDTP